MSLSAPFYGRMTDPTAAKGTLPPEGVEAFFIDTADSHWKVVDSAGTVTDLTQTAETTFSADITFDDGIDIAVNTSTGTKIGTASTQKLGFFGATPVVQASALTAADGATVDGTYGAQEQGVISNIRVRVGELSNIIKNLGFSA